MNFRLLNSKPYIIEVIEYSIVLRWECSQPYKGKGIFHPLPFSSFLYHPMKQFVLKEFVNVVFPLPALASFSFLFKSDYPKSCSIRQPVEWHTGDMPHPTPILVPKVN